MKDIIVHAAISFGLGAGSAIALPQDTDPKNNYIASHKDDHTALAELICTQAKHNKYIVFGDTNHGSTAIRDAVNSPAVLQAIQDCTPGVMVLEGGEKSAQKEIETVEHYADLRADIQKRHDTISIFEQNRNDEGVNAALDDLEMQIEFEEKLAADTFDAGKGAILRKHFQIAANYHDPGYNFSAEQSAAVKSLWSVYNVDNACIPLSLFHQVQMDSDTPAKTMITINEVLNARNDINRPLADTILQNYPEGAVIMYGAGHINNADDLNEMLGTHQSVVINLVDPTPTEDAYDISGFRRFVEKLASNEKGAPKKEAPDFTYNTQTQDYKIGDAAPVIEKQPMPEERFESCRTAMSPQLRDAFVAATGNDLTFSDYSAAMDINKDIPQILDGWEKPAMTPFPAAPKR